MNNNKYFCTYLKKYGIMNKKGFTLVELIVTLALTMLLMTIIFSFLINYLKINDTLNDDLALQEQARNTLNIISDKIMQSDGIAKVYMLDNAGLLIDITNNETKESIRSINIKYDTNSYYSLYLKDTNLYLDNVASENDLASSSYDNIIARYISDIYIEPLNNKSFMNTNLVSITIDFKKDNEEYTINQNICIRNK